MLQLDMLDENSWDQLPELDIPVSNPLHIPLRENSAMKPQVTAFEPHLALFVPDDDPLRFYRALGLLGRRKLNADGVLYAEIHEDYGQEVADLWQMQGYTHTEIIRDMQGKQRIVHAHY